MKKQEIKFKGKTNFYSIIIGKNTINLLPNNIKRICPRTKKIALIYDKNVPRKFIKIIIRRLKKYSIFTFPFFANEKNKSLNYASIFLNNLLSRNFNRNDLVISIGGGITGDVVGFVASVLKRGINFINIPTTLLAQVDSAVGGKTGVNSIYGKNLIGSFKQPRLVVVDTNFLYSLPKKEMVCGYAEILKHAIIKDKVFFNWLKKNSNFIFAKNFNKLIYAIKKSCQIKIDIVKKDVHEKGVRMKLNFGHTFAHAIEVKNNYSKKISHGEAVLSGIILATRLSVLKKICKLNTLREIEEIYFKNKLTYTTKDFVNTKNILSLIPFLKNDKKNNDDKINFILLKKIGVTTEPNTFKISASNLKNLVKYLINGYL